MKRGTRIQRAGQGRGDQLAARPHLSSCLDQHARGLRPPGPAPATQWSATAVPERSQAHITPILRGSGSPGSRVINPSRLSRSASSFVVHDSCESIPPTAAVSRRPDCSGAFPRRCRVSCRRAAVGQAGAPAALAPVRARARTNELDAGERGPMIGSEERACWLWGSKGRGPVAGSRDVCAGRRSDLTSTHPAPARAGGRHDRDIRGPGCSVRSSSAAWPAHGYSRARPGPGDPSGSVAASRPGARALWRFEGLWCARRR